MRLVLVGPPGSGKGTQAEMLVQRLGLKYIGTGDILRAAIAAGTPAGKQAQPYLKAGKLAPDELVNALVEDLFRSANRPECFVLDGYPRTVAQARWFDELLRELGSNLTAVVQLAIADEEVVRRMGGRRICPHCNTVYHISDRPPKIPNTCDKDSSSLIQRTDDREDVIRARLEAFHETTDALLAHYNKAGLLRTVPSRDTVEAIFNQVLSLLNHQA